MPADSSGDARLQEGVNSLLIPGETLEGMACQRRIFALTHRRSVVAATTGRFIGLTRGLFGGFEPVDVRWQDLKTVHVGVGVFGASLTLEAFTTPDLAVSGVTRVLRFGGLRKAEAQRIYRICQAQDQAWREKRRIRELEELRAKSGGIQLGASSFTPQNNVAGPRDAGDPTERLAHAKEMLQKGLINDSEYESLKARIIGSI
jgi:hypothetical protein